MNIRTKIKYYVPLNQPNSNGKAVRRAQKTVDLWLQEASPEQLIPAFLAEGKVYYWYQEHFWVPITVNHSDIRDMKGSDLDTFIDGCANGKLSKVKEETDTYEVMYERAVAQFQKRLVCDKCIYYQVEGEPRYGISLNPGGWGEPARLSIYITTHESSLSNHKHYSSLDTAYLHSVAEQFRSLTSGNCLEIDWCSGVITILRPDLVTIPSVIAAKKIGTHYPVKLEARYMERHKNIPSGEEYGQWNFVPDPVKRIEELKVLTKDSLDKYQIGIEYTTADGKYAGFYDGIYILRGQILDNQKMLMPEDCYGM